ncbi:MAG: phosphomannomutase/phosphoglucomutase [Patescibacteria group bacterium]
MESISKDIFKAYDIRGLYPTELNEAGMAEIARAYYAMCRPKNLVIGRDARLSSAQLKTAFVDALRGYPVTITDLGLIPSEVMYFAVGKYGYDAGAMITASHNPADYNGIRFVDQDVRMIPGRDIRPYLGKADAPANSSSRLLTRNIIPEYIRHALTFIDRTKIRPLSVVVDAGNGMAGTVITELAAHLPIKVIPLFFELDGRFPNRPPNPVLPEARTACCQRVRDEHADFGVLFDGDADRAMFITEKGEWIRGDISLLLLAKQLLKKYPGKGVSYNVVCSRAVPEKIAHWGGRPLRTPVGFVNVSGALRKYDGILGGETSAHYCFRDNYYADSGLIAFLTVLGLLSEANQPLSRLVADFNPYHRVEEYFTVSDQQSIVRTIEEKYADGKKDRLDGLTVEYDDWWFNVRPSNTEPILRLTIEAVTEAKLQKHLTDLEDHFPAESKSAIIVGKQH